MNQSDPWFARWFNADYLALYSARDDAEAERQIDFIRTVAPPDRFPRLVDIACGGGRHIASASRAGYSCVGIDLSPSLLATAKSQLPRAQLVRGDMRSLPFASFSFDLALSLFTSIGYFDSDEEHVVVAAEWRRVLRPGGKIIVDYLNPYTVIDSLVPEEVKTVGEKTAKIKRYYDQNRRRLVKEIELSSERSADNPEKYFESVRIFSIEELKRLLTGAGFSTVEAFGGPEGKPFECDSARLVLVGS